MGEHLALALALEGRVEAARAETATLVSLAGRLTTLPEPAIDAAFAAALEARLLAEEVETAPEIIQVPRLRVVRSIPETPADEIVRRAPVVQMPRRRLVVRRGLAAAIAAASLGAFPVVAAAQALPGTPFYGMKISFEKMQIALFGDRVADAFTYVKLANARFGEAKQLDALGKPQDLIATTIARGNNELRRGFILIGATSDRATLARFMKEAHDTQARLESVSSGAFSERTKAALESAIDTSRAIQSAMADRLGLSSVPMLAGLVQGVDAGGSSATESRPRAQGGPDAQRNRPSAHRAATDTADQTGHGKEVRGVEGCRAPASTELNDTLGFMCRTDAAQRVRSIENAL